MDYPKSDAGARLKNGKFTDGDPVNNIPPSKDSAVYQNMVFDELINAITEGGATPDATKSDQLAGIIRQLKSGSRILGEPFWHLGETPPTGALFFAGQLLSRSDYPELWAALNTPERNINLITDTEWLAGQIGCWSTGDGATTFRAPELRGEFIRVFDNGRGINQEQQIGGFEDQDTRFYKATANGSNAYNHYSGGPYGGAFAGKDTDSAKYTLDRTIYTWDETHDTKPRSIAWPLAFYFE